MAANQRIDLEVVLARIIEHGAEAVLTRGEAAALVASRTMEPHDDVRGARNRVAMQLDRVSSLGRDATSGGLARLPDGRFVLDEIVRWARKTYPGGNFDDLPTRKGRVVLGNLRDGMVGRSSMSVELEKVPGSLEEAHGVIQMLKRLVKELRAESASAETKRKAELVARFKKK